MIAAAFIVGGVVLAGFVAVKLIDRVITKAIARALWR